MLVKQPLKRLGFAPDEVSGYMSSANKQCYALQKLGETARLDPRRGPFTAMVR